MRKALRTLAVILGMALPIGGIAVNAHAMPARPADLSGNYTYCDQYSTIRCLNEAASGAADVVLGGQEMQAEADGSYDGHTAYVITDQDTTGDPYYTYCGVTTCGDFIQDQGYFTTRQYSNGAQLWWIFADGYMESVQALGQGVGACMDANDNEYQQVFSGTCVSGYGGDNWTDNSQ